MWYFFALLRTLCWYPFHNFGKEKKISFLVVELKGEEW